MPLQLNSSKHWHDEEEDHPIHEVNGDQEEVRRLRRSTSTEGKAQMFHAAISIESRV